ncbi:hypothetical protein [Bradyrhizobium sp. Ash2021]|uniref:hypothetical protein n=1 Tax=Bradyrhizobium sp. Ash2021 TaxID=2954771 RepID=UPI0028155A8C|nr:hypothetical protein [Bradyrhizobium sp. Ash2021]WMT77449.1 hypothetical protein NL528_14315 [Bradyrhizobium sp. Ash2021]
MSQAENMPSTPLPLRALTMFDHIPAGCILRPVTDDDSAPHLRAGEFAIVDTTDTEPQHGEVYLVRFHRRARWPRQVEEVCYIQQVIARSHTCEGRSFIGFWTQCLNFEPYVEVVEQTPSLMPEISHRSMADGPRMADEIQEALIGRVVGIYQAEDKPAQAVGGKNEP